MSISGGTYFGALGREKTSLNAVFETVVEGLVEGAVVAAEVVWVDVCAGAVVPSGAAVREGRAGFVASVSGGMLSLSDGKMLFIVSE